ncbi:MAG TPA: MBL fold metallo-hydrolase [Gemmatimonadaceae bacterium]|nr:MBL fold metallo-hydrolase [Gemmatimonadaceae bacterium]
MKLTFLGTGTSFGIPQIGCSCRVCYSTDPRDKRTRVGAVVETASGARLLIDTPPELRLQLIAAGIDSVDAILFTHEHADHTNGIDDVRAFSVRRRAPVEFYGSEETLGRIARRFDYIFDDRIQPLPGTSKPEGKMHALSAGETVAIAGVDVTAVPVPHGPGTVFAYRIGSLGYITDAGSLPPAALEAFRGVRVLVLNALFHGSHPMHLSIPEAVRVATEIGAARTYLTHLTHENLHADLEAELPAGVAPAYDGLVITVD